jgi:hypothetical protein
MSHRSARFVLLGKLVVAAMAIVAIVAIAARQLVPSLPLFDLLLYCAVGVAVLLTLVVLGAICSLQFSQFILRAGGTDAQWFWFSSEPKGLVAMRAQQSEGTTARDRP